MKHLFIINPTAGKIKGEVDAIIHEIKTFFQGNMNMDYDIHVTRWCRDAVGFTRRYVAEAGELVRIHSYGGAGILYEILNGVIGLPNVQIACHPMGSSNNFIRYFGKDNAHLFGSLRSQVFSGVTPIDVISCGKNYAFGYSVIGLEGTADMEGRKIMERTGLPWDFCCIWAALSTVILTNTGQHYKITLDGKPLDGEYSTILIANIPCYASGLSPAVDAHPNDGLLDIYLMKSMPKAKLLAAIAPYISGNYRKLPGCILHYAGKKLAVFSDETVSMSLDGENFYANSIKYELIPYAVDFVCPDGIDIKKLPRIYNRPEEGYVGD